MINIFYNSLHFTGNKIGIALCALVMVLSCTEEKKLSHLDPINWERKSMALPANDSLIKGSSYLSIYSSIYDGTEKTLHHLTATASMRNVSNTDTIYILKAEYYNTKGDLIRTYFNKPIFLKPLETIEIVIDQDDKYGGTGANFVFDWAVKADNHEPIFEAVMISTTGQQGISFTTRGIKL
ncbi:DUF3124 domain-containing protein [Arenibacter sp. BSSL-BM3]|uniref:DUF3124 domain-containing protein n=1 Tax=Arenibacter arenosicollis TaxID=2762274 RepID=A0ABR7QMN7_9FLAO|nr:DUF3124 domain-containing protein [Arenibacter arenosicollis]MBC8768433.1 DUF3124 domain-containing protein [Arenibacter arenosicollis]